MRLIDYIKGELTKKDQNAITVEAAGIGYEVFIPVSTYSQLPSLNQQVRVLIYFHVREDMHRLYGFASEAERTIFINLIGVNKIGPRVGLSVLSELSVEQIVEAVRAQNPAWFASVSGIGQKTAQRMVMELKGKLDEARLALPTAASASSRAPGAGQKEIMHEAAAALSALGYSEKQVQQAIYTVAGSIDSQAGVEEWVRQGLQHVS